MIQETRVLSEELSTGAPSFERAQELMHLLDREISQVPTPLVHGTSSEYLQSMVEHGIGGHFPAGSTSTGKTYYCPADVPSGLLGSYAFALRSGATSLLPHRSLSFHAHRSVIERYVSSMHVPPKEGKRLSRALTVIGLAYALKRGKMHGSPMLVIVDGNAVSLQKTRNGAAVDFFAPEPLPFEQVRIVLVPAKDCRVVEQMLAGKQCRVLPLELLEVREIALTPRAHQRNLEVTSQKISLT